VGGSEGNRGYLVQALIAVLGSLQDGWDRMTIEPDEPDNKSEKVDILFEKDGARTAVQVKSSRNQISKSNAEQWAKELQERFDAEEYELILVGQTTRQLTNGEKIDKVRIPRPKNLDLTGLEREAAHLLDRTLSAKRVRTKPDKRELLVRSLVTDFLKLASDSCGITRSLFESSLIDLVKETSPSGVVDENSRVLSMTPDTPPRNLVDLIGRENETDWLRKTRGDRLIIGQPGIGKTFLLSDFVNHGFGLFLRASDPDQISEAVETLSPKSVVVENAHLQPRLETIKVLKRLRNERGFDFEIVADCWPGKQDVVLETMGIRKSNSLTLEPLSDEQIVAIAEKCGIVGPNLLLHMIVHQASGYPGRVVMLVDVLKGSTPEDRREFWEGKTLTQSLIVKFGELVGEDARRVLACFAIGGNMGSKSELVADVLGMSTNSISKLVSDLAAGGVVSELRSKRLAVMPALIRAILVKDYFFGPGALPYKRFLGDPESFNESVRTLVHSVTRGASLQAGELLKLVQQANTLDVWASFVHSSKTNAEIVLRDQSHLLPSLANDLLAVIPDLVVPELLRLSRGDDRSNGDHTDSDHLVQEIKSWAQAGIPGRDAIVRREILMVSLRSIVCSRKDCGIALCLLPIIVSPVHLYYEQSPSNRKGLKLFNKCLTTDELKQVVKFWKEIIEIFRAVGVKDWNPVLAAVKAWLDPTFFGDGSAISQEQWTIINESAQNILVQLTSLSNDVPGVQRSLAETGKIRKIDTNYVNPSTFAILYPNDFAIRQDAFLKSCNAAIKLGESWANRKPTDFAKELSYWKSQAKYCRQRRDFCYQCCVGISGSVDSQLVWVDTIIQENLDAQFLEPFIRRAIKTDEKHWDIRFTQYVTNKSYRSTLVIIALTTPNIPAHILDLAIENASVDIKSLVMCRDDLTDLVISKLLSRGSREVRRATVEGYWHKTKRIPSEKCWFDEWKQAFQLTEEDYCVQGVLEQDNSLGRIWLELLCSSESDYRSIDPSLIDLVTKSLKINERRALILGDHFRPNSRNQPDLIKSLVGDSVDAYGYLLENENLENYWTKPLERTLDDTWCRFAEMAIEKNILTDSILSATEFGIVGLGPIPDAYEEAVESWKMLRDSTTGQLKSLASEGLQRAQHVLQSWITDEREHWV